MSNRLLEFVVAISRLVERGGLEHDAILSQASAHMTDLVKHDDWLPDAAAQPHPERYQQHLLFGDPLDRFSLVSFVWGPGQFTPVHDHTVWGVIGMLRGAEKEIRYERTAVGGLRRVGADQVLQLGQVACVSPQIGDIHAVSNAVEDEVSISIHLYGGNIGRIQRKVYDPDTGQEKMFVSGYSNALVPNLWAAQ